MKPDTHSSFQKISSLKTLINNTLVITASVALTLSFLAFVAYDQITYKDNLKQRLTILAQVTANNSAGALAFEDEEAAVNILRSLAVYSQIKYASITNDEQKVLAEKYFNTPIPSPVSQFNNDIAVIGNYIEVTVPITWDQQPIGYLHLKSGMQELGDRTLRFILIGFAILLIALLLSLTFSQKLIRRITQPISNLGELVSHVSENKDYSRRGETSSIEEINGLLSGFNKMLDEIDEHETKLISSERRLSHALSGASEGSWHWNLQQDTLTLDAYSCKILGFDADELIIPQKQWATNIIEADRQRVRQYITRFFHQNLDAINLDYRIRKNGTLCWLHWEGKREQSAKGEASHIYGTLKDISKQKQTEEQIKLLATVFDNTSDGVAILSPSFDIVAINQSFTNITHYAFDEAKQTEFLFFSSDKNPDNVEQQIVKQVESIGHWHGEIWGKRKNREDYPMELEINAVYGDDEINHIVAVFSDITTRKRNEEELFFMANYDPLTQLPNRSMFHSTLKHSINNAKRSNELLAVLFIDLDKFKQINDTLGHDAGDELLVQTAERMKNTVRDSDTVARLSGDEFTIILEHIGRERHAEQIAKKLIEEFNKEYLLQDKSASIGASIGIAIYPNDAQDVEGLLKHADTAMYFAKTNGRNNFSFFDSKMNALAERRNILDIEMKKALEREQIEVNYQPKVCSKTYKIKGFEALARWVHPTLGMISPTEFIPIAEENGLIGALGQHILRQACTQLKRWHTLGHQQLTMAINVSAKEFQLSDYPLEVAKILHELNMHSGDVELELTESLVMENPQKTLLMLEVLRNLNVTLSIDDFGTGYSSLSYLSRYPLNVLKIDQSFIKDIGINEIGTSITSAIISIAHNLQLEVIAEGVENLEQLKILQQLHCEYIQGFLFSAPLTASQAEALLEQEKITPKVVNIKKT